MAETSGSRNRGEIYSDFDVFLKSAIHEYYKREGKKKKANFVALVIASGEVSSLALDSLRTGSGLKTLAVGAVSVFALRSGLKYVLGGPFGILLASVTIGSLIAYFIRHRRKITEKISRYRELVSQSRTSYENLQADHKAGRLVVGQRDLMIDGLMKRFLEDIDF
ncbi:MAG: hypothetical protein V1754_10265 [Pseudomonadota bacterium]